MAKLVKTNAMKAFFTVPEKPIMNSELMALRKGDARGYDELGDLCIAYYTDAGDEVFQRDAIAAGVKSK